MASSKAAGRISWRGEIVSIQPRIRMRRSFDQRDHSYHGYVLGIRGTMGLDDESTFLVGIGEGARKKHAFRVGDKITGVSVPVATPELETAGFYKTSGLKRQVRAPSDDESAVGPSPSPPFYVPVPPLADYRSHGHRRLDAMRYEEKCSTCAWGCRMPVEIIRDHWDRDRSSDNLTRRMETFCYGPVDCSFYKAGPKRKVRGRAPNRRTTHLLEVV